MVHTSAIPDVYYALFAFVEPFMCAMGFLGVIFDPKTTFHIQAPWPADAQLDAPISPAAMMSIMQLGHVCWLLGLVNYFVLSAARRHLASQPAVQERIVRALMIPLLVGDILHIAITFFALGPEYRWSPHSWDGTNIWIVIACGLFLMIPRLCWHFGVGRFVASRDFRGDYHQEPFQGTIGHFCEEKI